MPNNEKLLGLVANDVIDIVTDYLGKTVEADDEIEDLGFDSLDIVEIGMAFEDAFNMDPIEVEDLDLCNTVQDLIDIVEGKLRY